MICSRALALRLVRPTDDRTLRFKRGVFFNGEHG